MVKLAGAGRVVGVYIGFDLFHMLILSIATNERYSRKNVTFSLPKIFVIGLLIRLNEGGGIILPIIYGTFDITVVNFKTDNI